MKGALTTLGICLPCLLLPISLLLPLLLLPALQPAPILTD